MSSEIMKDDALATLRAEIIAQQSRPDRRRRLTMQVIERMQVAERAGRILIEWFKANSLWKSDELWHDAQQQAIKELRREGKIR